MPDKTTLAALGMTATPMPVGQALVDGITAGPDLAAPAIPGSGGEGRKIGAQTTKIGAVYQSGSQYYVMLSDGLAPVHEVTANLLNSDARGFTQISPAEAASVSSATRSSPRACRRRPPSCARWTVAPSRPVCAGYRGDVDKPVTIEVYAKAPEQFARPQEPAVNTGRDAVRTADRVVVAGWARRVGPGPVRARGARLGIGVVPGDRPGHQHGLGNAQEALGYADTKVIGVPAALLALVPTGPGLDPAVAQAPVGGATPPPGPSATPSASPSPTPSPSKPASPSPKPTVTPSRTVPPTPKKT